MGKMGSSIGGDLAHRLHIIDVLNDFSLIKPPAQLYTVCYSQTDAQLLGVVNFGNFGDLLRGACHGKTEI